jgi:hypothetical protein
MFSTRDKSPETAFHRKILTPPLPSGDGRIDYMCVDPTTGDIHAWRNGGQGVAPAYWQDLGIIWTGGTMGDIAGFRFVDINGDGSVTMIE